MLGLPLAFFVGVLLFEADQDDGSWAVCLSAILTFSLMAAVEAGLGRAVLCMCAVFVAVQVLLWLLVRPSILNRGHLALWVMYSTHFRNVCLATPMDWRWSFEAARDFYRTFAYGQQ